MRNALLLASLASGRKRICRTQAEWDAARANQRRFTGRGQTQGSSCLRGGAC